MPAPCALGSNCYWLLVGDTQATQEKVLEGHCWFDTMYMQFRLVVELILLNFLVQVLVLCKEFPSLLCSAGARCFLMNLLIRHIFALVLAPSGAHKSTKVM
jgi:hypothetical protein